MAMKTGKQIFVRRATADDAEAILTILDIISRHRVFTAIDEPWSADQQRRYISCLSVREALHVGEQPAGTIVGYQTLELWAPTLKSMSHVGEIGTFVAPERQRRGIGEALFRTTLQFASNAAFRKFVVQVRSANTGAQAFYQRLGFRECGRLARQVRIDGRDDDEILMEYFM
jgi:ribosomal protein S18 acetylase RimI-like enzyme